MPTRNHSANPGRHNLADRGADLYETPAEAVHALLRVEQLPQTVWEPAAGPGSIVRVLREAGHVVVATDLNDWGCPASESRIDFLLETRAPADAECVITNPPYKLAEQFVSHALELVPRVIMLLRSAFYESERRTPILESGSLARIHQFRNRLPMMHRHGWAGPRATSSIQFAWFVWDKNHSGPTTTDRISASASVATRLNGARREDRDGRTTPRRSLLTDMPEMPLPGDVAPIRRQGA
jgi:hypothetical protein